MLQRKAPFVGLFMQRIPFSNLLSKLFLGNLSHQALAVLLAMLINCQQREKLRTPAQCCRNPAPTPPSGRGICCFTFSRKVLRGQLKRAAAIKQTMWRTLDRSRPGTVKYVQETANKRKQIK